MRSCPIFGWQTAARNATVRFDETRLDIGHLKSTVRQRGHDPAAPAGASARDGNESHIALGATPATSAPAEQKTAPPSAAGTAQTDKVTPPIKPDLSPVEAAPGSASVAPKSPPDAAPAAPAGSEQKDNAAAEKDKS